MVTSNAITARGHRITGSRLTTRARQAIKSETSPIASRIKGSCVGENSNAIGAGHA